MSDDESSGDLQDLIDLMKRDAAEMNSQDEVSVVDESEDQDQTRKSYMDRILAEHGVVQGSDASDDNVNGDATEGDDADEDYAPPPENDAEDYGSEDMDIDENDYASDESSIFIYEDSDDEEESDEDDDLSEGARGELAWRLAKEESYSDWTIEVSIEGRRGGRGSKKEYHVHRERLATGVRKCEYFAALFASVQFKESEERMSRIKLPKDAADAFPAFLDYLYLPLYHAEEVVDADNMRALRYLANYFLTHKLNEAVNDFIENDMRKDMYKLEAYLDEFGSDDSEDAKVIIGAGALICAERIYKIAADSSLLLGMSPAFLLQVFTLLRAKSDLDEKLDVVQAHICKLGVAYIRKHRGFLDEAYFSALTRLLHLPDDDDLAGPIALDILEIMKEKGWTNGTMLQSFVAALSRYLELTDADVSPGRLSELINKIPTAATAMVLSDAINGKKNESVTGDDIEITFIVQGEQFGRPVGEEIELSLHTSDCIRSVKYFLSRKLGAPELMGNINLRETELSSNLEDHKTLSDHGIEEGSADLLVFWSY